jgi:hypothetical protein
MSFLVELHMCIWEVLCTLYNILLIFTSTEKTFSCDSRLQLGCHGLGGFLGSFFPILSL